MRRCGTWAKHAGVPLRRVRAGELREEFLYELKAGQRAAGGRPRPATAQAAEVTKRRALRLQPYKDRKADRAMNSVSPVSIEEAVGLAKATASVIRQFTGGDYGEPAF